MSSVFAAILNMSITASIIVFIVLIARFCLRKAPKIYSYILWSVVLFRLLCPVTLSLPVSFLAPVSGASSSSGYVSSMEYISAERGSETPFRQDNSGGTVRPETSEADGGAASEKTEPPVVDVGEPAGEKQPVGGLLFSVISWVWFVGAAVILGISLVQTIGLKLRLSTARPLRGNIYETDEIETAFVLGVLQPKIYLPLGMNFDVQKAVIVHEQTHQRRGDQIIKLIAYFALALHWFNPVMWYAYKQMVIDMEKSCDEAVIRKLYDRGYEEKSVKYEYSKMLFAFGSGKNNIFAQVAFGEHSTKQRIKNVLAFKRLKKPLTAAAAVLLCVLLAGSVVNPKGTVGMTVADMVRETKNGGEMITIGTVTFPSDTVELDLSHQGLTDISGIEKCGKLQVLNLSYNHIEDYSPLLGCKNLRELILEDYTELRGNEWKYYYDPYVLSNGEPVANRYFYDRNEYLTAEDMLVFSQLPKLERLSLFSLTKEGAPYLSGMSGLKYLDVSNYNLFPPDEDYSVFGELPRELALRVFRNAPHSIEKFGFRFQITDEAIINSLIAFKNLKTIDCLYYQWGILQEGLLPIADANSILARLSQLESLEELHIMNFPTGDVDFSFVGEITSLKKLVIEDMGEGEGRYVDISSFSKLKELRELELSFCGGDASAVYELDNLVSLSIGYPMVVDVSRLGSEETLETLELDNPVNAEYIQKFKHLKSLSLSIENSGGRHFDMSYFGGLDALESLSLVTSGESYDFSGGFGSLRRLYLYGLKIDAEDLRPLTGLRELYALAEELNCGGLENLSGLQKLELDCESGKNFSVLFALTDLEELRIKSLGAANDISFIRDMTGLKKLSLTGGFSDISCIKELQALEELELMCNTEDLSPISGHNSLISASVRSDNMEEISITDCEKLVRLEVCGKKASYARLSGMPSLKRLGVTAPVQNIDFIKEMQSLEIIELYDGNFSDISPLYDIPNLKALYLSQNQGAVKDEQYELLREYHPDSDLFILLVRRR